MAGRVHRACDAPYRECRPSHPSKRCPWRSEQTNTHQRWTQSWAEQSVGMRCSRSDAVAALNSRPACLATERQSTAGRGARARNGMLGNRTGWMPGPHCLPGIIRYGPHQSESGCQWPAHLRVFGVDVNQTGIDFVQATSSWPEPRVRPGRFPAKRRRSGLCKAPRVDEEATSPSSWSDMLTND